MKKIIIYTAVFLAISCQQTIDPFEKKFSCLLTKEVTSNNQTTTYQYDASDRLTAIVYYDSSKETYTYGTNGKLQVSGYFNSSGAFLYSWEPTYSSDGTVSKVVNKNSAGTVDGEYRISYTSTSIKLDYYNNGVSISNYSEEYTFNGVNLTRQFNKITDGAGRTSRTYEYLYSDFQSGISAFYVWTSKIPGYPFPYFINRLVK